MKAQIVSTKEIRNDLEGFLRRIKQGQTYQVMYRSKPLVTLTAAKEFDDFTAADAGTPASARRSAAFVRNLPTRKPVLDPGKNFKQLYDKTKDI